MTGASRFGVAVARIRMPLLWVSLAVLGAGWLVGVPFWLALALFVVALAVYARIGTVRADPVELTMPVAGRWQAINSPADRVPSHLIHAYGQTYAIDLVHVPGDDGRPSMGWAPLVRPPDAFPAFGQPVLAPADATVVRVRDRQRDHASRTSWPALVFMLTAEAALRELRGPNGILGNHVVLDLGDGVFGVAAHLRRGSARVRPGEVVHAGEPIAECGNTGNSTEPHLHFQLMDHPNVLFAAGLPVSFRSFEVDGSPTQGVPSAKGPFVAPGGS